MLTAGVNLLTLGLMTPGQERPNTPNGAGTSTAPLRADAPAMSPRSGRGHRPRSTAAAGHATGGDRRSRRGQQGTIYNRFGGRQGLIDAVIEELVGVEMRAILDRARQPGDPWERLATYITTCATCSTATSGGRRAPHDLPNPRRSPHMERGGHTGIALVKASTRADVLRADSPPTTCTGPRRQRAGAASRPKPKRKTTTGVAFFLDSLRLAPDPPHGSAR